MKNKEPWEEVTNFDRVHDGIVSYHIFCEDKNSEPNYFESFGIENKLKIITCIEQKQ